MTAYKMMTNNHPPIQVLKIILHCYGPVLLSEPLSIAPICDGTLNYFYLFFIVYFSHMYICVCAPCACVCMLKPEEDVESTGTGDRDGCEWICGDRN